MHLKKLILENFRQFYGKQELDLDTTQKENIIVIHGENGSGKTTILEAFSWCLYGELNLINSQALLNEKVFFNLPEQGTSFAKVTLIFEDRHREYQVTRKVKITKVGDKQYYTKDDIDFDVMVDGEPISGKTTVINKILSKDLKGYFFFDGERIDKLAKPESASEIEEGIKNIMGVTVYENAIRHLKQAKKDLTEELKEYNNSQDSSPYTEKEKIESELEEYRIKLKNNIRYKDEKEKEHTLVSDELKKVQELEKLEDQKTNIENEIENLENKLEKLIEKEKRSISKQGYLAISQSLIKEMHNFLEEKREKGELPSGIREQFIQDLIERGRCICGTEIHQGDEHFNHLTQLLNQTFKKGVEDGFLKLNAFTGKYLNYTKDFLEHLKEFHQEKMDLKKRLNQAVGELEDLKHQIKESAHGQSLELVKKREDIERIIEQIIEKIGVYKDRIKQLESALKSIKREIEKYQAKSRQEEIAEKRVELCEEALEKLNERYEFITEQVRRKLSNKVSKVFQSIIPTYNAKINDRFELEITKSVNGNVIKVATSTGENQIASLSFIGSLVNIAKEWDEKGNSDILTGAGVYPIVMDSPFGALDKEYRDLISAHLQKLAPQIIVFVSTSQWSAEVKKNLEPYIHHEYILQYHTPIETKLDNAYKILEIDGKVYDLTVTSDFEFTKIVKVK